MPRAHRLFLPNHIWHITHQCHQRAFLLKFSRDRRRDNPTQGFSSRLTGAD